MHGSTVNRLSSPLASHIEAHAQDQDWVLAHFTFMADITTLEAECDIALSPAMSVASLHTIPNPDLAFIGNSANLLANYASFLIDAGSEVELLVNEVQRPIVMAAFTVLDVKPQWQMVFRGSPRDLDTGSTTELVSNNLPAMHALANGEDAPLRHTARDLFKQGPAFGIWDKRKLVAMGTTNLRAINFVQIGNIIARRGPRRRAHISQITAALIKAHATHNAAIFLIIPQQDREAAGLFEHLGFTRERPMYRMHCLLKEGQ